MPSRIDIGPEGGPFVAINENSNDLELQDINGNVIAVWDETAGQWDLNNNSLTNIDAIDASSATLEQVNNTGKGEIESLPDTSGGTLSFTEPNHSPINVGEQFRVRLSESFKHIRTLDIRFLAGPATNVSGLLTEYIFDNRNTSFIDKQEAQRLSVSYSSTDYQLTHTGSDGEYDLIFQNNSSEDYTTWALHINQYSNSLAGLSVVSTNVEDQ